MRRPQQRKRLQRKSLIAMSPAQPEQAAARASYSGSPEHKLPHARSDATLCPPDLEGSHAELTLWLRSAISAGDVGGLLEGAFPRYVWYRDGERLFEGRLTNQALGEYKGYPINSDEWPVPGSHDV